MAKENPTWPYRRIQSALTNLGHPIDAITVHNVLRHHRNPASQGAQGQRERFVRSIKNEALAQMLPLCERSLSYVIQQYLAHYHAERNYEGLAQLLGPEPA